jgi:SAM-dependent methyltransferase
MGLTSEHFITKYQNAEGGQERANYAMFLTELCQVLDVPGPDVAGTTTENNDYVFERAVTFTGRDGTKSQGRIDLYKRGSFVLEAKQSRQKGGKKEVSGQEDLFGVSAKAKAKSTRDWDVLMLNARQQAENYARHLPATHEWPPFILVCDVGHCFEIYADFTGKGRNYTQFPDRQGFRIYLSDLANDNTRQLLKAIWTDPTSLDPSKKSAKATREIASALAEVSKRLEKQNHPAEEVALFLMRCLFTMFAEDSKLIPEESFTELLEDCAKHPDSFMPLLNELWGKMNSGGFSTAIRKQLPRFNGKLFVDARVFPMGKEDIGVLKAAATKDWTEVDPSIFGTLLEQALSPADRSSLGAHYTPRAYVERLVIATVIEPLREEWNNVQGSLEVDADDALARVKAFHQKLCETKVLDPACGTGNFLYVTLELMKRLEGEVLDTIERLGGQDALRLEKFTVDPHQFLGIEINPRAAAIAELVLWIGYLRWHLKTKGVAPPEPILREFKNIERRDAVLAHDGIDAKGKFINPRRPEWPEADYIVGNPPFIGAKFMRERMGDAYVETLWKLNKNANDSADFVMYWWDRAADILTRKNTLLKRFGLVTTNSITQVFQRRVMESYFKAKNPISLLMAIPDHPWTKATKDSASVRIAMTVAIAGQHEGLLYEALKESDLDTDEPKIELKDSFGKINSDLSVGTDVTQSTVLLAAQGISSPGVKLHGSGFIVTPTEALHLGLGKRNGLEKHIRNYRNGRDLTGSPRNAMVIDLFGLELAELRTRFPEVYQYLLQSVKVQRDQQFQKSKTKDAADYLSKWWLFGKPRTEMRPALVGLQRYIVTPVTPKHRVFSFLDIDILPDDALMTFAFSGLATV